MVAENINLAKDLNLNLNEIQNAVAQNLITAPTNTKGGLFYFDSIRKTILFWNGDEWVDAGSQGKIYVQGTGITINGTTISIDESVVAKKTDVPEAISELTDDTSTTPINKANTLTGLTASVSELNYVNGATSNIQSQLDTKLTKNTAITAGTATKITYDANGLVLSGSALATSDIPDLSSVYLSTTLKGAANGLAELDSTGKIPSSQLPSYVDDVVECYTVSGSTPLSSGWLTDTSGGTALTPEQGKLYVVVESGDYQDKQYRWSGSTYVEIISTLDVSTETNAGIIEIATQGEVNTGTDDTRAVTPKKLAAYTNGMSKKITATNPALTPSGGVCAWAIPNTLGTEFLTVMMIESATGDEVIPAKNITQSTITLKMNSTSVIAAGTYKASIEG